jgi:hydroxymethylbilane synthase
MLPWSMAMWICSAFHEDVPTVLPIGIVQAAVWKSQYIDILVHKESWFLNESGTIATGSLRRQAQWLNKYPTHKVVDLRGNVNLRWKISRIQLEWVFFAAAGLERINWNQKFINLDWMIPAPAGALCLWYHGEMTITHWMHFLI